MIRSYHILVVVLMLLLEEISKYRVDSSPYNPEEYIHTDLDCQKCPHQQTCLAPNNNSS